jgi:hypothetical protein
MKWSRHNKYKLREEDKKMEHKDISYTYLNKDGKIVSGTAATNHEIYTVHGGLKNYHDYIGSAYVQAFVNEHSDIINTDIIAKSRRDKFQVMGG